MDNLYFCEPNFLKNYLTKIENVQPNENLKILDSQKNNNKNEILHIDGNIATIEIIGSLSKEGPDWIDRLFGFSGTSYLKIIESLQLVEDDPSIDKIILAMDTPGGKVNGVDETFQAVQSAAKKKNVIVENHGMVASAGYYIASAAKKIIAMAPTVETGSIGVVFAGIDDSKRMQDLGFKEIIIRSSNAPNKFADIGTKKGQSIFQKRADDLESVFISRVATGRKVTEDFVKENFGKGGLLIASDAKEVGMIDKIINSKIKSDNKSENNFLSEEKIMDLEKFLNENPGAKAEFEKRINDAKKEAFKSGEIENQKDFKIKSEKLKAFLNGENTYPETVVSKAIGVLTGENTFETFDAAVAAYDAAMEAIKSKKATDEQGDETPPEGSEQISDDGQIKNGADYDASVKNLQNIRGVK